MSSDSTVMATRLKKLEDIEALVRSKDRNKINEALKQYNELCLDQNLSVPTKIEVIVSFSKHIPEEASEMITRLRDLIPFMMGKFLDSLLQLLAGVAMRTDSGISDHDRSMIGVTLYNRCVLGLYCQCFESIALDEKVDTTYRVEACRFLYGSDQPEYKAIAQECLLDIISFESKKSSESEADVKVKSFTSEMKYKIIAGFISNSGVVSYLNATKIKVPYDEEFLYGLQHAFFHNGDNGARERILSGQHIIQMNGNIVPDTEKLSVEETLLTIASDPTHTENIRADAADVLTRLARKDIAQQARKIIVGMGHSGVSVRNTNFMERVKTVYNNSQNVHDEDINISTTVNEFIETIFTDDIRLMPFDQAEKEISNLIRSRKMDKAKNFLAYKALTRLAIDTATFSDKEVKLAEIMIAVWMRIKSQPSDARGILETRLIDELVDMGDTCSTGHSFRFVNILNGFGVTIRISFRAQIIANITGRVNAAIRDLTDIDVAAAVSMGMFPEASEDDRKIYREFIKPLLEKIHKDMFTEFVTAKYISETEFSEYFNAGKADWDL